MSSFTAVTLFAGIGASSLAIRNRGGYVLGAVEFEAAPAETLRLNGFNAVHDDVRNVDHRRFGQVDVIIGGPPCQPFSQGGRNKGQDDERDMIPEFIRAVRESRPKFFILENVRGLAGPRHKAYLEGRLQEFRDLGYAVDYRVLDSADYGVGQSRKRLFILGRRADAGLIPHSSQIKWPTKRRSQITMAEALDWSLEDCIERNSLAPEPARVGVENAEAALWPLHRPSTTVVGSFMPQVQAAPGYRSAGDGPRQNAPGSVVTTFEERLALQCLPRDWKVAGTKAKRDLQVGNSVPVLVVMALLAVNGF